MRVVVGPVVVVRVVVGPVVVVRVVVGPVVVGPSTAVGTAEGGQRGERGRGARQGFGRCPDQVTETGSETGQGSLEEADLTARVRHAGQRQNVKCDGPVGPPGHVGRIGLLWQFPAVQLGECEPVEVPADARGVY